MNRDDAQITVDKYQSKKSNQPKVLLANLSVKKFLKNREKNREVLVLKILANHGKTPFNLTNFLLLNQTIPNSEFATFKMFLSCRF